MESVLHGRRMGDNGTMGKAKMRDSNWISKFFFFFLFPPTAWTVKEWKKLPREAEQALSLEAFKNSWIKP